MNGCEPRLDGIHFLLAIASFVAVSYVFGRWRESVRHLDRLRSAMRHLVRDIERNDGHERAALPYMRELLAMGEDTPMPEAPEIVEPAVIRLVKGESKRRSAR